MDGWIPTIVFVAMVLGIGCCVLKCTHRRSDDPLAEVAQGLDAARLQHTSPFLNEVPSGDRV